MKWEYRTIKLSQFTIVYRRYMRSNGRYSKPEPVCEVQRCAPDYWRGRPCGTKRWTAGAPSIAGLIKTFEGE